MKDELIKYETAVLAKEKKFDWDANYCYSQKGILYPDWTESGYEPHIFEVDDFGANFNRNGVRRQVEEGSKYHTRLYSAPTQSLLTRWLREVHNFHIEPFYASAKKKYMYDLRNSENRLILEKELFDTYEEALEAGLLKALKLIK